MSYSESYDQCMAFKGLPLLGELLSRKTLSEAVEVFEEIHQAVEAAGGAELTLEALAVAGPALGLSESALEALGLLAAGGANVAAHIYLLEAVGCLAAAVTKNLLLSELDAAADGAFKDQILSRAIGEERVA